MRLNFAEIANDSQNQSHSKNDSADNKDGSGACANTQALGHWFGFDYVSFVAHGRITACHPTLGHFKSGDFVDELPQAFTTTIIGFDFGTSDALQENRTNN